MQAVNQMKAEILADKSKGVLPLDIGSFGELHNYVDANCYGGFCEDSAADSLIAHFGGRDADESMPQGAVDFMNDAQNEIDMWLRTDASRLFCEKDPKVYVQVLFPEGWREVHREGGLESVAEALQRAEAWREVFPSQEVRIVTKTLGLIA
jgi:hypothetical protein